MTSRVLVVFFCLGIAAQAADQLIVLKAARLFDGKSNALVQNAVVIVQGDKIVRCRKQFTGPERRAGDRSGRCNAFTGLHGCAYAFDRRFLR